MKYIDMTEQYNDLVELFDEEKQEKLNDIFDSIFFKLNKNVYHYNRIQEIMESISIKKIDNFYDEIHLPIYYEMESFLVSLRSSVDMLLQLINFSYDLGLKDFDLKLSGLYNHKKLPIQAKNIFQRFTRLHNNKTWNFISFARNEIVHESSVNQVLPITIDMFSEIPSLFMDWDNIPVDMLIFFKQCIRFLENFHSEMFTAIKISMKN